MENRMKLHQILQEKLGSDHVYFQPPESVKMEYPCFVYFLDNYVSAHADDLPYKVNERYLVTFISRDPLETIPKDLARTHGFSYDRHYTADNLHHTVFNYNFY